MRNIGTPVLALLFTLASAAGGRASGHSGGLYRIGKRVAEGETRRHYFHGIQRTFRTKDNREIRGFYRGEVDVTGVMDSKTGEVREIHDLGGYGLFIPDDPGEETVCGLWSGEECVREKPELDIRGYLLDYLIINYSGEDLTNHLECVTLN
jgi:hypothetical protein